MTESRRLWRARTGVVSALLGSLLAAGVVALPAGAVTADGTPEVGDVAVTAGGTELAVSAVDPPSRTSGAVAVYTPAFGTATNTNPWGAEAVLVPTDEVGAWEVSSVCTALSTCADPSWRAGGNEIPADGLVLSVSPGGSPDVRAILRDEVSAGDVVRFEEVVSRRATTTVDVVDPSAENNPPGVDPASGECYPGCRGAEQLVVYTGGSGRTQTGTNDYGFEVRVVDGIVVGAGGNDSEIPADGTVLSGHGSRGTWLQANAPVGAAVVLDGDELTVTVDERAAIYGAEQAVLAAGTAIDDANASCVMFSEAEAAADLADAETLLADAREAAAASDAAAATELADRASSSAATARYRTAESRTAEGRGVWVRPEETTPAQIRTTLDRIDASGFNVVFLESIFQGTTIYPSAVAAEAGVAAQRPSMVGFDPLQVWIEEAHARGIELHPWVHSFYVGSDAATDGPGPVLSVHPEWAAVEREDVGATSPMPSSREPGYYFLDAAIPEARQYVTDLLAELMGTYDVDGVHLDYIRYPVSLPWETAGFSYSDYSRSAFEAEFGVDPYELSPDDAAWADWNAWREENVTSFVRGVRELQQSEAPDVQLSAAVFANPSDGLEKKFQNWGAWADEGLVDFLTGMTFGTSADSVGADTLAMRERVTNENLLYTATYGPFRGSTPQTMLDQVASVVDAGSDGAALFAYNQLTDEQAAALADGPFRNDAVVPHADRVGATVVGLDALRERVAGARDACVDKGTSSSVDAQLKNAAKFLGSGKVSHAQRALDKAADRIGRADVSEPGAAVFVDDVERDLAMYGRWLDQVG
ncbi:glycoside hydrolase family 10 protein [Paraoerskovia marina]|uniref:glycoside hydrolase family 10 protein n=1 Tax=Paraoerskovia marina TaxID=545619 RepID=UPI000A5CA762|nr:family 10 glycosylhydrolase [Paraoerskovia marina]